MKNRIRDLSRLYRQFAVGKVNVYRDIPKTALINEKINTLIQTGRSQ